MAGAFWTYYVTYDNNKMAMKCCSVVVVVVEHFVVSMCSQMPSTAGNRSSWKVVSSVPLTFAVYPIE